MLEVRDIPCPQPAAQEALVKIHNCGICGSDLHFYHGSAPAPRACLGHEIAGEVVAVGDAVERVRPGDLVAVEPLLVCRQCPVCLRGDYQLCPWLQIIGFHRDGGFAEYLVLPEYALYRLPEAVDTVVGVLTEPLAVGVHAVRLAQIRGGERVLVLGAGTIGLLAIAAARAAGAGEVWVTARHPQQAAAARELGASHCFGSDEDEVLESTQHQPVDVVIETVGGEAETLAQAIQFVRPGGQVAVLGVFSKPPVINALALMMKEVRLFGSMTYGRDGSHSDFDTALQILAAQPEAFRKLVTHRLPLPDITRAFEIAGDKRSGSIKVMVFPKSEF